MSEYLTIQTSVRALQRFLPAFCLGELLAAPSMVYSSSPSVSEERYGEGTCCALTAINTAML